MSLEIVPITFRQACDFIAAHHRHHGPLRGMKFAVGVAERGVLAGVAVAGRPVARLLDDGRTLEVTRTCTLGTPNANSELYSAIWRAARAMGYHRVIIYTQRGESGASLRAAGWQPTATLPARRGWDIPGRRRPSRGVDGIRRIRWEIARDRTADHSHRLAIPDRGAAIPNSRDPLASELLHLLQLTSTRPTRDGGHATDVVRRRSLGVRRG
jgi:hypothetical protein